MGNQSFDLEIGDIKFKNPVVLSAMGGINDSNFINQHANKAGLAFLGGYSIDQKTKDASKKIINRGREEFILDSPLDEILSEISNIKTGNAIGVNLRSTTLDPILDIASVFYSKKIVLELDAHCRQKEIVDVGAGEALLSDIKKLTYWIKKIKETGVVLSIKFRVNIIDDINFVKAVENAGVDIIHVDAMLPDEGSDLDALKKIRDITDLTIIGNNSITDFNTAKEMLSRGCDFISVARGVAENPSLISELVDDITQFQEELGWYNSPKHLCSGKGDLRSLTFCCVPVKPCALLYKLKKLGLAPQDFVEIKKEFGKGTMLEYGDSTCFGSLLWCCKISKPCFLRDGVLDLLELSPQEYMTLKKELSEYILDHAKVAKNDHS